MQTGETEIFEVKRHPFGILTTYIGTAFILLVFAILIYGLGPVILPSYHDQVIRFGSLLFLIMLIFALVIVGVAHIVYWGNRWILTSDSLTQVTQFSLFNKQSSQLSLANLEDVTAQTNGILAKMFNFGILKAETAGEHSKFTFIYCPNPEKYAQLILLAREQFEQGLRNESEPTQVAAPVAPQPVQPPAQQPPVPPAMPPTV